MCLFSIISACTGRNDDSKLVLLFLTFYIIEILNIYICYTWCTLKIEAKSIIVVFKRYLHFFLSLCVSSCKCVCAWMCKLCLIWRNIFSSLNLRMCEIESLDFMHESDCRVLLKYMQCKICHPPFCFHICTIKWNKKHFVLRSKWIFTMSIKIRKSGFKQ